MKLFLPLRALFLVLFLLGALFTAPRVNASGFTLRTVGGLNVDGLVYSHLWYTKGTVTFMGGTLPNEVVTATIDGAAATATADATGNWTYSATLADGDHTISFSSIASTVSFTLTIGAVPSGIGGLPTATSPTVGNIGPTVLLLAIGLSLLITPAVFLRRTATRSVT